MSHHFEVWTPGAVRVLSLASAQAEYLTPCEVSPTLLLWALLAEESHATESLQKADADLPQMRVDLAEQLRVSHQLQKVVQTDQFDHQDYNLARFEESTIEVLKNASELAPELTNDLGPGTDALLVALLRDPHIGPRWWQQFGIDSLALSRQLRCLTETDSESATPIQAEFELKEFQPSLIETHQTERLLDALANRLREGLRVIEDQVRFIDNQQHALTLLKELRHDFTTHWTRLGGEHFVRFRQTDTDVGTQVQTRNEYKRTTHRDVLTANCKRVSEALRSLEENGKLLSAEFAAQMEALRYRFYTVEQNLLSRSSHAERLINAHLYLLVTKDQCHNGFGPTVKAALKGGVDIVQLREKEVSDQELLRLAEMLREWTADAGALMILNDRPDLALLSDADGVHLGQDDLKVAQARQIVGSEMLIGISSHSVEQAHTAIHQGADYLGVGPVFPSQTKSFSNEELAGLEFVKQMAAIQDRPWFAIGGINEKTIAQVSNAGGQRAAISNAILQADDPEHTARMLKAELLPPR